MPAMLLNPPEIAGMARSYTACKSKILDLKLIQSSSYLD